MRDYSFLQKRYLRDPLPIRLGGLASDLARIRTNCDLAGNSVLVLGVIDESKHFIEWTIAEVEPERAGELVNLQQQLTRWQDTWSTIWPNNNLRREVAEQANLWSEKILDWSGLLDEE